MAGKPGRRMVDAVARAAAAIDEGRIDDAKRALKVVKRAADVVDMPLPPMPPEVTKLWEMTFSDVRLHPKLPVRTRAMDDEVRDMLLQSGKLGAERLLEMMQDDAIWVRGATSLDRLVSLVGVALQRAYGPATYGVQDPPSGRSVAQQGEATPATVGHSLSMMIRTRQVVDEGMRDVTQDEAQDEAQAEDEDEDEDEDEAQAEDEDEDEDEDEQKASE